MAHRLPSNSRRSYVGVTPLKLRRPCPREDCLAKVGRPCTKTDAWGLPVALKDTHQERKPKKPRKGNEDA